MLLLLFPAGGGAPPPVVVRVAPYVIINAVEKTALVKV